MSASTSIWPSRDAYQTAVLNPERNLRDTCLHGTVVAKLKMGTMELPHPRSGNFGAVYKFSAPGRAYALKVFDKAQPDRQERYAMVDRHLAAQQSSPHLVSLHYDPQGVRVAAAWYPTLLMDWVDGPTLDSYMEKTLKSSAFPNGRLCRAFVDVMQVLEQRHIAHGDLQHGNILVLGDGKLKLVDYDGMFVPAMQAAGLTATEIGMPAYQHPKRFRGYFDGRLDHFSALVILLTLACVTPDLWKRYPPDENCLIVRESDLVRPDQSPLLAELSTSPDRPIAKLAAILKRTAKGELNQIPTFADLLTDPAIRSLADDSWRPTNAPVNSKTPRDGSGGGGKGKRNDKPSTNRTNNGDPVWKKRDKEPPIVPPLRLPLHAGQQEIAALIAVGYTNADMARLLSVSENSIAGRVNDLLIYASLSTRAELSRWAAGQAIEAAVQERMRRIRLKNNPSVTTTTPTPTPPPVTPDPPPVKLPDPKPPKEDAATAAGGFLAELVEGIVGWIVIFGGFLLICVVIGFAMRIFGFIKPPH